MNYPEELREKWNECMFDERDIIQKFLKDQYDLRFGRQRDTWHFEPAIELVGAHGTLWDVRDIRLDKDKFVVFSVDTGDRLEDWECFNFAYGELSKIIEALPDADEIVKKNVIEDLNMQQMNLRLDLLLKESPFTYELNGEVITYDGIDRNKEFLFDVIGKKYGVDFLVKFRDHIHIEHLHRTKEYKEVMNWLALEPNLRKSVDEYAKTNYGCVLFTLAGTDIEFDMSAIQRDDKGNLTIFGADTCCEDELITLTEKDIKKEYLEVILKWLTTRGNIMDEYNGHNKELVRKINAAWRDDKYHDKFEGILHALLERDYEEYCDKFEVPEITTSDYAMNHAHEIMEGVCDDLDLETILNFIRYEED